MRSLYPTAFAAAFLMLPAVAAPTTWYGSLTGAHQPRVPHATSMPDFFEDDDGSMLVDGDFFPDRAAYLSSPAFVDNGRRCGFVSPDPADFNLRDASDCSFGQTIIRAEYAPENGPLYRIPVVVHVLQRTNGTGFISAADVQSQIDVMNEDFRALPGTNGAPGTDTRIEFFLATEDPAGNPTTGITYTTNNTFYNDGGDYWLTLSWDPDRYMNIYTNSARGFLGYVPVVPAGSPEDRVVVLWEAFGRNAPAAPYNLGRTATHEVGHYLGLEHTFRGGCGGSDCYTTGDFICDTNAQSSPTFGCPSNQSSCGSADPVDNYMDYSFDACMTRFTPEQANRMRCYLTSNRQSLYEIVAEGPCSPADLTTEGSSNGIPDGAVTLSDFSFYLTAWSSSDPAADLTTEGSASGIPDGAVTLSDFSFYLTLWSAGCP